MAKREILLSFHVYKKRGLDSIFRNDPMPDRCAAGCHGERTSSWQCHAKGNLKSYGGYVWCGTHYPPVVHARAEERQRQRSLKADARSARWAKEAADNKRKERALEAIKLIAAGHNDPRALAQSVLADQMPAEKDED